MTELREDKRFIVILALNIVGEVAKKLYLQPCPYKEGGYFYYVVMENELLAKRFAEELVNEFEPEYHKYIKICSVREVPLVFLDPLIEKELLNNN